MYVKWNKAAAPDTGVWRARWKGLQAEVELLDDADYSCACWIEEDSQLLHDSRVTSLEAARRLCELTMCSHVLDQVEKELERTRDDLLRACNDSSAFDLGRDVGRTEALDLLEEAKQRLVQLIEARVGSGTSSLAVQADHRDNWAIGMLEGVEKRLLGDKQLVRLPKDAATKRIQQLEKSLQDCKNLLYEISGQDHILHIINKVLNEREP